LSLDKEGNVVQSSAKTRYYLDETKNIKEQVFELRKILPKFDIITNLKNNSQELANIMHIGLYQLATDNSLDVPPQVLDPLQQYLLYSSDFKKNRVQKMDATTAQYQMQKKAHISMFNKDSESNNTFQVTISDFWYKNRVAGRFVVFHRSIDEYSTLNRPL
jgi:hypothetical protein